MNLDETIKTTIEHIRRLSARIERVECSKCNSSFPCGVRCETCPFGQVMSVNNDYLLALRSIYVKAGA